MRLQPETHPRTPAYMGLRVNRYNPAITSFFGGSQGASVPLPSAEKSRTHHIRMNAPANNTAQPNRVPWVRQGSLGNNNHGTRPATTAGRARKANRARRNILLLT